MGSSYLFCFVSTLRLLAFAFAAPPPAASLTRKVFEQMPNSTLSFNLPLVIRSPLLYPRSSTPPLEVRGITAYRKVNDPWDMSVPSTFLIIEWYGYRDSLPVSDAQRCVKKTTNEAAERVWGGYWDTPMEQALPYSYLAGSVHLWLKIEPGETLTWLHWSEVLFCFPLYVEANEWRGTQFAILRDVSGEPELVAVGHLLAE